MDLIIVTISLLECFVEALQSAIQFGSVLTAFRALRLLRVFKLAKSNRALSILLESIARTLYNLGTFTLLLILVIFIFNLLGMQLFAGKLHLNDDDTLCLDKYGYIDMYSGNVPTHNFDDIRSSFVTVFQILSGEDWPTVMYD